jgi:hypothetical protein
VVTGCGLIKIKIKNKEIKLIKGLLQGLMRFRRDFLHRIRRLGFLVLTFLFVG